MTALFALVLIGCAERTVPEECVDMCHAATNVFASCLLSWGVQWQSTGYADAADYTASCETWAWEMSMLETDAVQREVTHAGVLQASCDDRLTQLTQAQTNCEVYTQIDWNTPPWVNETTETNSN